MRNKTLYLMIFGILFILTSLLSVSAYPIIPKVLIRQDFIDSPFIEVNQITNLTLFVYDADNSHIIIDDLNSSLVRTDGTTIPFVYSGLHYWRLLQYNTTGSKRFQTFFTRENSTIRNIDINVSVVEYVNLSVELYKDVNLSKHYSDSRAYIIAYPLFKHDYDFSMYRKLGNSVNTISTFLGNNVEQATGIDLTDFLGTQLYLYSEKVFEAQLVNGVAIVEVPKGYKYNIDLFAPSTTQNFLFVGNRYKEMYYKSQSYDLSVERSLLINSDVTLKAVINRGETHPVWYWSSKIIFILLIIGTIVLPILILKSAEDTLIAGKTFLVMFVITLLVGLTIVIVNWVVY